MLIRLGIFIFGMLFVIRISKLNVQKRVFGSTQFEKIILSYIFLSFLIIVSIIRSRFLLWVIVFALVSALLVTIFVTQKRREREFRQDFVEFLDRTIAQLRSGQGFLFSIERANQETPLRSQRKIKKMIETLPFADSAQFSETFWQEIFEEFLWIKQYPSKTLQRLLSLRHQLKIEEKFRRKSGRVIRQAMIQVVFLVVLFVSLTVITIKVFGFFQNIKIIFISSILFLSGLSLFYILGVGRLWKI